MIRVVGIGNIEKVEFKQRLVGNEEGRHIDVRGKCRHREQPVQRP